MKRERFMKEAVKNENVFGDGKFTRILAVVNILIAPKFPQVLRKSTPAPACLQIWSKGGY